MLLYNFSIDRAPFAFLLVLQAHFVLHSHFPYLHCFIVWCFQEILFVYLTFFGMRIKTKEAPKQINKMKKGD
jgi:hypothetical protein